MRSRSSCRNGRSGRINLSRVTPPPVSEPPARGRPASSKNRTCSTTLARQRRRNKNSQPARHRSQHVARALHHRFGRLRGFQLAPNPLPVLGTGRRLRRHLLHEKAISRGRGHPSRGSVRLEKQPRVLQVRHHVAHRSGTQRLDMPPAQCCATRPARPSRCIRAPRPSISAGGVSAVRPLDSSASTEYEPAPMFAGAPLHFHPYFSVDAAPQPVNFTPNPQSRNTHILYATHARKSARGGALQCATYSRRTTDPRSKPPNHNPLDRAPEICLAYLPETKLARPSLRIILCTGRCPR